MSATAESLGNGGDVELPFAAQAHPVAAIREFAKESCYFYTMDCQGIVHQAFAIFIDCSRTIHLIARHPYPRE